MTGIDNRTGETAEAETEQTAETEEITETETLTETGTDNSTGVGTGKTPRTKIETGHSRETGTQGIEMVTQETEDAAEKGDKREQQGQITQAQTE
jgi:hypothetical protein